MAASPAILQSLSSLLPHYSSGSNANTFPPALLQLCTSLHSLSQQRASHLKPEEEIARTHACCEIACNRLRARLRLPAAKSGGAPCKPRVYTKLVAFLEQVLEDAGTPKKRTADGEIKPASSARSRNGRLENVDEGTPTKKTPKSTNPVAISEATTGTTTPNTFAGRIKATRPQSPTGPEKSDGAAPLYTMPMIRTLCRTFSTPALAPHVYTGVSVILQLSRLWPRDDETEEAELRQQTTTLTIAVYLMVLARMQQGQMTAAVYTTTCQKAVEALKGHVDAVDSVERWIQTLNVEKWCTAEHDWWDSVPEDVLDGEDESSHFGGDGDEQQDVAGPGRRKRISSKNASARGLNADVEVEDPEGVLLPGLGTMMQDAVDWTSDERRADYLQWKAKILRDMDVLDKPSKGKGRATRVA